ncbi:MAG: response regulator [Neisseriaceae bacterium]|nr:response regulator [Neisseriaceae bacterium PsAf]MCV2502565.1 response regulator [Neisseriaceae bacterium]MCV2509346.1 response regulator [Neisseriaceae bacterium]
MKNILVVEDEKNIQDMVSVYLKSKNYKIFQAYDYIEALEILTSKKNIDLILLDWMIPKGSGIQLLEKIKEDENRKDVPVIMLSAKIEVNDRIEGLNKGADDYLTKPFSLKELLARVEAHLRRVKNSNDNKTNKEIVEYEGIKVDTIAHRVFINNKDVQIRRIEFKLLNFLASHPDRVFSRSQLLDNVWGIDTYVDERTVDVSIGRLKRILEPTGHDKLLQTVRGEGYRFSNII